jgi:hypothetical protein
VIGDMLEPDEITRLFGIEPDFSARKGEARQQRAGTVIQRIGVWSRRARPDPAFEWDLDGTITALLADFPADLAIWHRLADRFTIDMFCGLFMGRVNQGAELAAATLQLLAERRLTLDLDVYGPPSSDEAI